MTYNICFNNSWDYLKTLHPIIDLAGETLDLSVKPAVTKKEWCHYISALHDVITIGRRENFITFHVDGHGCAVYIKLL